jgi:hypothetical protein
VVAINKFIFQLGFQSAQIKVFIAVSQDQYGLLTADERMTKITLTEKGVKMAVCIWEKVGVFSNIKSNFFLFFFFFPYIQKDFESRVAEEVKETPSTPLASEFVKEEDSDVVEVKPARKGKGGRKKTAKRGRKIKKEKQESEDEPVSTRLRKKQKNENLYDFENEDDGSGLEEIVQSPILEISNWQISE